MSPEWTTATLRAAIARIADRMEECRSELNERDGQLGDGDLGVTLANGFSNLRGVAADLPDDVGMALMSCAQALTRSGGSSYSTLLATGLMAAAKETRGKQSTAWAEIPDLLAIALEKMAARGKSALGEKTVLDAVEAARAGAVAGGSDPVAMAREAKVAVAEAIERFRNQPCRQGRARIFAEKSKGLDDPGMVAFQRIIEAVAE